MYFPILRGRQNELLAIRELQDKGKLSHVTPIIEPVKASSTLLSVISQFKEANKELIFVMNPKVGSFEKELSQAPDYMEKISTEIDQSGQLVEMHYCGGEYRTVELLRSSPRRKMYYLESATRDEYNSMCASETPYYTLVSTGSQRLHRIAEGGRISLELSFKPQSRNADYFNHESDFLTEEPFYFKKDGFFGFSDFSVIGEEYNEGGFAPKVVALHLVHLSEDRTSLCVRHFTSLESTTIERGIGDVAGKFHEALGALIGWADTHPSLLRHTIALQEMRTCFEEERFPGLGVAKKLAIKHHLEMVDILLGELQ